MLTTLRKTGLDIIGDVPWATHFCQFYQTPEDLLDMLVPYFKSGLQNNEFGMWVTAEPLNPEDAHKAMSHAMADFDRYVANGQMEILPHTEWYLKDGYFDLNRVLNSWVEKYEKAVAKGYDGIRVTGNTAWLEEKDWGSFTEYEAAINDVIGKYRMLVLCTYNLDKCSAHEIIDVVQNHQFAVIKQHGKWQLVENSSYRAEHNRLDEERKSLSREIDDQRQLLEAVLDQLPVGIHIADKSGKLIFGNKEVESIWRHKNIAAKTIAEYKKYLCFHDDGSPYKPEELPMARTIMNGEAVINEKINIQRGDGSRGILLVSSKPVQDTKGEIISNVSVFRDITEVQQANDLLRENEERLRQLYNSMNEGLALHKIIYDDSGAAVDYIITDINPVFESLTSLQRKTAIGSKASELYGTDVAPFLDVYARVASTGKPTSFETYFAPMKKHFAISVFSSKKGEFATVFSDITERKQAEEKLRETRDYLDNLVNYANAPIIVWDPQFRITRFNRAFERLTGLSANNVLGKHLDILFPDDSRAESLDKIHMTLTGERWEVVEIPIKRTDGAVRTVLWNSANVFAADGKTVVATMAQGQDFTEIKNAELVLLNAKEDLEARVTERTAELVQTNKQLAKEIRHREKVEKVLKESESRLLEAQQIAHLGNWDWNIETNELLWSDEVYRIFGLKPQQFKATYDAFVEKIHPDDRNLVTKSVDNALYRGKAYSINHRIITPDGSIRTVHETGYIKFKKRKPVRMTGTVHDITEHKLAEDRLRVLSHKLLQIQEEERRTIAREIHDQIGQSITLLSFTLNKAKKTPENFEALLPETDAAIHDLAAQVREISHNLRPGILDDLGLVPALSWEFEHYTKKTNIQVRFEHSDLPVDLPPQLNITAFRIIQEALTNVARHAGVNEVTVQVSFHDTTLTIEIEDRGVGFNPDIVERSSFGLVGMRERANLIGGDLKLESAQGKGTRIIVNFPVDADYVQ